MKFYFWRNKMKFYFWRNKMKRNKILLFILFCKTSKILQNIFLFHLVYVSRNEKKLCEMETLFEILLSYFIDNYSTVYTTM
jgi:hypothetical protein